MDTSNSFTIVSGKIRKIYFLTWAGLRHCVPTHLKTNNSFPSETTLILTIDKEFDVLKKKSKDYYVIHKNNCPLSKKFATSESIVQFIGISLE